MAPWCCSASLLATGTCPSLSSLSRSATTPQDHDGTYLTTYGQRLVVRRPGQLGNASPEHILRQWLPAFAWLPDDHTAIEPP